jgi:hypothetical protein
MRHYPYSTCGILGCIALLTLASCRGDQPAAPAAPGVSKSAEDGEVSLKMSLAPAELPFDAKAVLTIEAVAPRGVTVDISDYQELIREAGHQYEFRATRTQRTDAMLSEEGKLRWQHVYTLEFFVPGEFDLPPATMTYLAPSAPSEQSTSTDDDPAPLADEAETAITDPIRLQTESIHVQAHSTDEAAQAVSKLSEIKTLPPKEMPEPWARWVLISAAAATAAILAILMIGRRMSRNRGQKVIVVPAHEWFDRELAALLAGDLISKGRIQEFHYRISDILRGYIERRFHVHAREMTTEEFLAAAGRDNRFGPSATVDLNNFLTACDMVKYARHTPGPQQADELVRTAGEFVTRTRERLHQPAGDLGRQLAGSAP